MGEFPTVAKTFIKETKGFRAQTYKQRIEEGELKKLYRDPTPIQNYTKDGGREKGNNKSQSIKPK